MRKKMQLSLIITLLYTFIPAMQAKEFNPGDHIGTIAIGVASAGTALIWQAYTYITVKDCKYRFNEELAKLDNTTQKIRDERPKEKKNEKFGQEDRKKIAQALHPTIQACFYKRCDTTTCEKLGLFICGLSPNVPKNKSFPLVQHHSDCREYDKKMYRCTFFSLWGSQASKLKTKIKLMRRAVEETKEYQKQRQDYYANQQLAAQHDM